MATFNYKTHEHKNEANKPQQPTHPRIANNKVRHLALMKDQSRCVICHKQEDDLTENSIKHQNYKTNHSKETYSGFIARIAFDDKLWCFAFEVNYCLADFTADWSSSRCTSWNIGRWQFSICGICNSQQWQHQQQHESCTKTVQLLFSYMIYVALILITTV